MSDDLADEAMERTLATYSVHKRRQGAVHAFKDGWRECRRRAEAVIEEEKRKAFWIAWHASDTDTRDSIIEAAYKLAYPKRSR